jgi:hypothetical protein
MPSGVPGGIFLARHCSDLWNFAAHSADTIQSMELALRPEHRSSLMVEPHRPFTGEHE